MTSSTLVTCASPLSTNNETEQSVRSITHVLGSIIFEAIVQFRLGERRFTTAFTLSYADSTRSIPESDSLIHWILTFDMSRRVSFVKRAPGGHIK